MQPGQMHDRTQNAQSRINPQTRNARRANGQQRTQLPNEQSEVSQGGAGPSGIPGPAPAGDIGLADRLAAMRAQMPTGGGRAGGASAGGAPAQPASVGVPMNMIPVQPYPQPGMAQPQQAPPAPPINNEMIARYVDELRQRLLFRNGGA